MRVMKEEAFGPVVPFMKVADADEAVSRANESHLGLGAYVFASDLEAARRIAERIEVGSVMINDVILHGGLPEMPWGGIKQSGHGVARSDRALKELCHARHINEPRLPGPLPKREPHWFPYTEKSERRILKFLKTFFGGSAPARLARWLLS
jgi:succinate-semialdehyde dehydrogenase/glutarate-semialdehyde dehydrogenase